MTDPTNPPGAPRDPGVPSVTAVPTVPASATSSGVPEALVHHERRRRVVGWQSRDILRAAALVVAMYIALRLLWVAQEIVFVVFLGTLFGLAVSSAVDRLQRFRIPRGVGAGLTVIGFLAILGGFGAWMAPTLRAQSRELRARLPQAMEKAEQWVNRHQNGLVGLLLGKSESAGPDTVRVAARDSTTGSGRDSTRVIARDSTAVAAPVAANDATRDSARIASAEDNGKVSLKERIGSKMGGVSRYLFPFLSSTLAVFGGLLLIIFLSIYIAAEPSLYRSGIMHLFPRRARARADQVLGAMAIALRKWLVTQLIAMAVIGGVSTIVLLIMRVKAAVALGILAGLFEFIPTVGPILSSIPAIAMGFIDSPEKALAIAIAYILIQFLENHILIPLLMRGGVDLPPALTVVTQAVMALVFGFLGLMVAVPLLAAVMVPVKMLYVEGVVGDPMQPLDEGEDDDR
ncbi:MAG: AI-2E family transporter [Gemmatimonadaceae bacterium]|nr:AI-2E family transporter [Gemmatimonadaceae bacterium]